MNVRCINSLVFILKLGKIVIVKEENSPVKRRVFLCLIATSLIMLENDLLKVLLSEKNKNIFHA